MQLGHVYKVQPMAPSDARTTWFDAGVLRIGVELRDLSPDELFEYYATDEAGLAEIKADAPFGIEDRGVSIHVNGTDDGHEYLRFDLFADSPHYHYVHGDGETNHIIPFDEVAHGPILDWAMQQLGSRLGPMLVEAQAEGLAAAFDQSAVADLVPRIEAAARAAQEELAATA